MVIENSDFFLTIKSSVIKLIFSFLHLLLVFLNLLLCVRGSCLHVCLSATFLQCL